MAEREGERVKFRSKGNWIWQLIKQWRRELSCCEATYSFWTCKVRPFIGPRVKYFTSYSAAWTHCVSLSFGKSSLMRLPTKQVLKNCSFNGQNKASSVFVLSLSLSLSLVQKDIGECKCKCRATTGNLCLSATTATPAAAQQQQHQLYNISKGVQEVSSPSSCTAQVAWRGWEKATWRWNSNNNKEPWQWTIGSVRS